MRRYRYGDGRLRYQHGENPEHAIIVDLRVMQVAPNWGDLIVEWHDRIHER